LLALGDVSPAIEEGEQDYCALGLSREHVPELIRMALDEGLHSGPDTTKVVWGPIHAWRALGQLKAEEAILPLLGLLRRIDEHEDDWVIADIPSVFARIGPSAIDPVADYLADLANPEHARICASSILTEIAACHPDARSQCIARICAQLERFPDQDSSFNAFLICDLLDLHAFEAVPIIEKAFAGQKVDQSVVGDWEGIQVQLGLKEPVTSPQTDYLPNSRLSTKPDPGNKRVDREIRDRPAAPQQPAFPKAGRNDPCPCGSGRKFKKCCGS
jgi:hypothetical protein